MPVAGRELPRLVRRPDVPVPAARRRPLERRRAADGARLRLHVGARPRPLGVDGVPVRGHGRGERARRPHARGGAARAAQLLPVRARLDAGLPLAAARLRRGRRGVVRAGAAGVERAVRADVARRDRDGARGQPALARRARQPLADHDPVPRADGRLRGALARRRHRRPAERAVDARRTPARGASRPRRCSARRSSGSAPTGRPCPTSACGAPSPPRWPRSGRCRERSGSAPGRRGGAACSRRRCPATTTTSLRRRRWTRRRRCSPTPDIRAARGSAELKMVATGGTIARRPRRWSRCSAGSGSRRPID